MIARRTLLLLLGGMAAGGWGAASLFSPAPVEFTRAAPAAPAGIDVRAGISTVHVAMPLDLSRIARRMDAALQQRLAMGLDLSDAACARKGQPADCAAARADYRATAAAPVTAVVDQGTLRIELPLRLGQAAGGEGAAIDTALSFVFKVRGGGSAPLEISRAEATSSDAAGTAQARAIRAIEARLKPLALTAEDELRKLISELPFEAATSHAWQRLAQSVELDGAPGTRLLATPEVAGAGELATVANQAVYRVPIAARISLETGRPAPAAPRRSVVHGQVTTAGSAAIRVATRVGLDHLQPAVDAAFVKGGPFETRADRFGPPVKVEIKRTRIYPAARALAVELDLTASRFEGQAYSGKAHLVGRPVLDSESHILTLADVGFPVALPADPRKPGAIVATAPRLASEPFAGTLASVVRMDLKSMVAETAPRISRMLNQRIDDRLLLSASLASTTPVGIDVAADGAWLLADVKGQLVLTYEAGETRAAASTAATLQAVQPTAASAAAAARRMPVPELAAAAVVAPSAAAVVAASKSGTGGASATPAASPAAEAAAQPAPLAPRRPVPRKVAGKGATAKVATAPESPAKGGAGRRDWVPFPTNN